MGGGGKEAEERDADLLKRKKRCFFFCVFVFKKGEEAHESSNPDGTSLLEGRGGEEGERKRKGARSK